jgi:hypothetical protein
MARYLLHHRHEPDECGVVLASFKGQDSPLRHRATMASCRSGGHAIWWTVDADSEEGAFRWLRGRRGSRRGQRKAPDSPLGSRRPASRSNNFGPHRRWVLVRAIRREDEPVAVGPDELHLLATARAPPGVQLTGCRQERHIMGPPQRRR